MTPPRETATDVSARVESGTAELVADSNRLNSWTLLVDGVAQSHVDLADPRRLEMMYVRMVAAAIDAMDVPARPVRALHLGAGGMTLARYIAATRPGSRQHVVELDRELLDFVRFGLPLPRDADITVQVGDARAIVDALPDDAFDLIITDVYRAAEMPRPVAGTGFVAQVARSLAPNGLYLVNVLDAAGLLATRRQLATVRTGFADTWVLTTAGMWKGKRDGNLVIAAAAEATTIAAERIRSTARRHIDLELRHGADLDRFLSGTAPLIG